MNRPRTRRAHPTRRWAVAAAIVGMATLVAVAGLSPAEAQQGGPSVAEPVAEPAPRAAAFLDPDPLAAPVRAIAIDDSKLYVDVVFNDPAKLNNGQLEVAVVEGTEAGDTERIFATVRNGSASARDQANSGEGWTDGSGLAATILPGGRLRLARPPALPIRSRSEALYVTVNFTNPAAPGWHSPPFPLSELEAGARVDVGLWTWAGPAIADGRAVTPNGTQFSIEPTADLVIVTRSQAPSEFGGQTVEATDDVLFLRPAGIDDVEAPFQLRFDDDANNLSAYRRGETAAIPALPGTASDDGVWHVANTGGGRVREYRIPVADLEAAIGAPIERASLLDAVRSLRLPGDRVVRFASVGTGIDLVSVPRQEEAAIAAPEVPSNSPPIVLIAIFGLVLFGLIAYGTVTFVRQTMWWDLRHERRRR